MTNDNQIKLPTYIEVPAIKKDAMVGNGPFKASKDIQQSLGFPGEKVDNWQQVAIDKIAETKSKYRSVQLEHLLVSLFDGQTSCPPFVLWLGAMDQSKSILHS